MSDISLFENFYIFISSIALHLNLMFHVTIFTAIFIFILKNHKLPGWHTTPLWWVGLSSLLCSISILIQYIFGSTFVLSYKNVGLILEVILNGSLALLALTFLITFFLTKKEQPVKIVKRTVKKKIIRKR